MVAERRVNGVDFHEPRLGAPLSRCGVLGPANFGPNAKFIQGACNSSSPLSFDIGSVHKFFTG